jgi:hypothetical protein
LILALMQPYFFPYIGYFELIARSDRWVVFDVAQYTPQSWMNRNRVLHPKEGWQYINVPVRKAAADTPIRDILLVDKNEALAHMLGQMSHYRGRAPHCAAVLDLVRGAFSRATSEKLADLNAATLTVTCEYLGIPFNWSLCSELHLDPGEIEHAGQWGLRVSQRLGASVYLNAPGGRAIFRAEEWQAAGIELRFIELPAFRYDCSPYAYVEHLSILDVLMWNRPETVAAALRGNADGR